MKLHGRYCGATIQRFVWIQLFKAGKLVFFEPQFDGCRIRVSEWYEKGLPAD